MKDSIRQNVVWCNGCFDIIHRGHIELFHFARDLGDYLVVGIDTDKRVKELKGSERPVNSLADRSTVLESIGAIDEVVCFGSDQELKDMIRKYSPRYLVVGSDYRDKEVIGSEWAEEVAFFSRIEGYSSTAYIDGGYNRSN
tara:strand:+ start:995 stop:1417 length:423 start_codon:yes stop_codon:yes gene_type:complete